MNRPVAVILDGYAQNPGDMNWNYLSEVCHLTVYDRTPPELIVKRAKDAEIVITNKTPLTREIIDRLPKLRFVALLSTGYNIVDGAYLREMNIPVSNIPSYSTEAVAQMVFAYILNFSNRPADYSKSVHEGDWVSCEDFCYQKFPLFELSGKTLGIVGFGRIGGTVAKIASVFGMTVLAYTPSGKKETDGVTFLPLDEMLSKADFVTLHCPLTAETTGLVGEAFLSKMKRGAYLINTSRGTVINETAVAAALKEGHLSGFAADVLSAEPPKNDNPLLTAENTILTPHIAWAGRETRERLLKIFNGNVEAFLNGAPRNIVN